MSRVEIRSPDTFGAPNLASVEKWVGSAEIAEMFGISRQRVYQLTSRPDFPAPMVRLKAGAVWVTAEVVAWAESKGRTVRDDVDVSTPDPVEPPSKHAESG